MNRRTRMQFFAVALLLKGLSDPEAVKRIGKIYSSLCPGDKATGLLLGYKLVIEAMLYKQIELIVTCPEILHLPPDDDLYRWWSNREDQSARRFHRVVNVQNH